MSLESFIESLLATEPGTPNSVQLEVDTDGDPQALFEVMLTIMTSILKKWYEPPITIGRVSERDLVRLVAYFASFGIRFKLEVEDLPRVVRINNRQYLQQSRLEAMKFQMSDAQKLYTVQFEYSVN
jgi:hypothetical protein